jgi:hypothetical protein
MKVTAINNDVPSIRAGCFPRRGVCQADCVGPQKARE